MRTTHIGKVGQVSKLMKMVNCGWQVKLIQLNDPQLKFKI